MCCYVDSKRPRVCRQHAHVCFDMCAWCPHTRRRFECTHGGVLNLHTGFSTCHTTPRPQPQPQQQRHTAQTPHALSHTTSHGDGDREEEKRREEKRREEKRREEKRREEKRREEKRREEKRREEKRREEKRREEKRRQDKTRLRCVSRLIEGTNLAFLVEGRT